VHTGYGDAHDPWCRLEGFVPLHSRTNQTRSASAGSAPVAGHLHAERPAASPAAAAEAAPAAVAAVAEQAAEAVDADDSESAERQNMTEVPACVHVVNNRHEAQRVAGLLTTLYKHQVYGADTEVHDLQSACCDQF
jgi:hypothetical protein